MASFEIFFKVGVCMNICQLGTGYMKIPPKSAGATEKVIYTLSKELSNFKNDVHIIDIEDSTRKENDLIYHDVWIPDFLMNEIETHGLKHVTKRLSFAVLSRLKLKQILRQEKFGVVHAHNQFSAAFNLKLIQSSNLPFVYTTHNAFWSFSSTERKKKINYKFKLEKNVLKKADGIIAISRTLKENIVKDLNIDSSKIKVIPNGVDTNLYSPSIECSEIKKKYSPNYELLILCVGRVSMIKNQRALVKAVPEILKTFPNVNFLFAGPIDDKEYFQDISHFIDNHNLKKKVFFTGDSSNDDMLKYFSASDVFVLPSFIEGFSLSILEALSCGKPLIVSNIKPNLDLIEEKNVGFTIDPNLKGDIAEKVLELLENDAIRKKFGTNARKLALKKYDWSKIAKRTLEYYEDLV